ncbi:hypothetical protein CYMTET_21676 [Cymbomonas tetramitiformis]|uniref:Uncharacterized protein n=1 Tax=Cymbomonas tetramitiformis TaxID=36881 RepID=A0AAE0G1F3_9CHLO|nr:hypothetical protein CYMTET_21676 [Cymbomonas tetramitiformis]
MALLSYISCKFVILFLLFQWVSEVQSSFFPAITSETGLSKPERPSAERLALQRQPQHPFLRTIPKDQSRYDLTEEEGDVPIPEFAPKRPITPRSTGASTARFSVNRARSAELLRGNTELEPEDPLDRMHPTLAHQDFDTILEEYKQTDGWRRDWQGTAGTQSRFNDLHDLAHRPEIMAELAPEHKKGYFRHAAQLVAAGVDHSKTWAPKTAKDGSHPHTVPTLTKDQFLSLPRSTRDFVRHHSKPEEKRAQWDVLNAKAAKQGWIDSNDRARAKGHNVPRDNPSRAHIQSHYRARRNAR